MNPSISDKLGLLQYEKPKSQKVKVNTLFFFTHYATFMEFLYILNTLQTFWNSKINKVNNEINGY